MAVFKCKMCGGNLEILEGMTVCECEFCGTNQTVPNADNEKKANLFNRANRLRFNNEFDAAAAVFENIVSEFPEEAEAYWGLCLCKYGIEYIDDPATGKKIPTCHRTSFESIFDDNNFELANEYADMTARDIYRAEAKEIDRLQKSILDIVKNEKPYDIFICYKETDEDGQRTKDSVRAQDIYDALTEKGYKVFFSRITLEDKLGQEYEPYIFSALNSAKIMLAVGTSFNYYNAVWVKNEWSRFLELMKKDKSKMLIPCYEDIDAYDMPKEFKNLQGQDMGKVGYIQDLVRGINKVLKPADDKPVIVQAAGTNVDNLLKRGFMALRERKWKDAKSFFERILDENIEYGEAYLGLYMAEHNILDESYLSDFAAKNLLSNGYELLSADEISNAYKFGNEELKGKIQNYNNDAICGFAKGIIETKNVAKYSQAYDLLKRIIPYGDSQSILEKINSNLEEVYAEAYEFMQSAKTIKDYEKAIEKFNVLGEIKDSREMAAKCGELLKEVKYSEANELLNKGCCRSNAIESQKLFETIIDYKDSKEKISKCQSLLNTINKKIKEKEEEVSLLEKRIKTLSTASIDKGWTSALIGLVGLVSLLFSVLMMLADSFGAVVVFLFIGLVCMRVYTADQKRLEREIEEKKQEEAEDLEKLNREISMLKR